MNTNEALQATIAKLIRPGRGILAADESLPKGPADQKSVGRRLVHHVVNMRTNLAAYLIYISVPV
jgi:hypothetical protein